MLFVITQFLPVSGYADEPAGVVLYPSMTVRQETGLLTGDQSLIAVDLRAGYRISSGFFFGMIYSDTSGGGTNSVNETAFGNSVGYFSGVFSIVASIYLYAQSNENTSTAAVTRSQGIGVQLDMGFMFPIGSGFSVGPLLTFKNISYKKQEDGNGNLSNTNQPQSYFTPYLGTTFVF